MPEVAAIRVLAAFVISIGIGLFISTFKNQTDLLTPKFQQEVDACLRDEDHYEHGKLDHALEIFGRCS